MDFYDKEPSRHFTSDNNSGVIPEILAALPEMNRGHLHAYGGEEITERAIKEIKKQFGTHSKVFFVFNGTAANVCALQAMTNRYNSVICTEHAHIHKDECGSPEVIAGVKLLTCPAPDAKLTIEEIEKHLIRLGDQHCSQPKVVSITQPTELGTIYTVDEIKKIVNFAHQKNLFVHMDGSRLVNAAIRLNKSIKEITTDLGVDVVCFGGTKNGLMLGDAIVFLNQDLARDFKFIRKQNLQLPGKMRFMTGQFLVWLQNDTWKKYAKHSVEMAEYLEEKLKKIKEIKITQKVETNVVFAEIPQKWIKEIRKSFFFYVWDETTFECRLMTTFDTQKQDIDHFIDVIKAQQK